MAALERFVSAASLALAVASLSACAQDFQTRAPDPHTQVSQAQASPAQESRSQESRSQELRTQESHAQEPHAQDSETPESPAQEPTRTGHIQTGHFCLDQKERRAESASGAVVRLAAAIRAAKTHMPGTVVQARLCHGQDGLVYVLTVLAHDGKVARIVVDAVKGTLVGER
ncbi:MAG: hypothetical protein WCD69_02185 [Xanthobacteraceae bacterium]